MSIRNEIAQRFQLKSANNADINCHNELYAINSEIEKVVAHLAWILNFHTKLVVCQNLDSVAKKIIITFCHLNSTHLIQDIGNLG